MIFRQARIAFTITFLLTLVTGLLYPLLVTGIAQGLFPGKANGSFIVRDNRKVGSELIGQPFSSPGYFWGRPSATSPYPYNAGASTGSNFGPLNSSLLDASKKRMQDLKSADPQNRRPVPVDLVTASGSGLDPHISVSAALYQVDRVARSRDISPERVRSLVEHETEGRQLGFLGETRVNVLTLNLALDSLKPLAEAK
jgi:potassium-transporting ATPase KdpC subunit